MIRNLVNTKIYKFPAVLLLGMILALSLGGCSEDEWNSLSKGGGRTEMTLKLDADVPFGEFRTRADAMGNNAVTSLWVGVYDIQTGNRVGAKHFTNPYSPVTLPVLYYDEHPTVAIVGVANYANTTDYDNVPLADRLDGAETWNDFVDLDVQVPMVNGAPVVDTDQPQLMMGILSPTGNDRAFYKKSDNGGVSVDNISDYEVSLVPSSGAYGSMIKEISGKKIYLKRLSTQVNVSITTGPQAEVTNVSYRRCNIPKAVYVTEHPTFMGNISKWADFSVGTSNFADTKMEVANGQVTSAEAYYSDPDDHWVRANSDNTFSFTHYENRHWGRNRPKTHDERESFSDKDRKIVTGLGSEYNNYASYMVIRMNILDRQYNRSAQVEYIIHEGFINDEFGNLNNSDSKGNDYCAYRNQIYNYNITVNGIDYIQYNVTNTTQHHDAASGVICEAEISSLNYNNQQTINISANSNLLFRFYIGRGPDTAPYDYMNGNMNTDMTGLYWPAVTENTTTGNIPAEINNRFTITKGSGWGAQTLSILQFIDDARTNGGSYTIRFNPPNTNSQWYPDGYKMGFYYFNPNETTGLSGVDGDECTSYSNKKVHVLEWKPTQRQPYQLVSFNISEKKLTNIMDEGAEIDVRSYDQNSTNSTWGTYGVDYVYVLTYNGTDYTLGNDMKFFIPMKELTSSTTTYQLRAVAINTKQFYSSGTTTNRITWTNPAMFDFTSDDFDSWYRQHFYCSQSQKRYTDHTDLKKLYRDGLWVYVKAGAPIGCIWEDPRNLFFGDWGDGNGLKFTVYKSCKISVVTYLLAGGSNLVVDGADVNRKISPNVTKQPDYLTPAYVNLGPDETSRDISIYWEKIEGAYVSITITEN